MERKGMGTAFPRVVIEKTRQQLTKLDIADMSFEARVECVRKNPGKQSLRQRKPIPHRGPTTENARAWVVEARAKGTKSNSCSVERSQLRPLVPGVG